jgi:hypothetical protein
MASKFLFLHSSNAPNDDFKTLDTLGSVLVFRDTYLNQPFNEVFAKYDVIILDVDNSKYKEWYSSYRMQISAAPHIKCIFLHHAHVHIDEKLQTTLRDNWKVDSIIKQIPRLFASKDDLINKLINNIHLPSIDTPAVESCFKSFLVEAAKKMGCGTD